MPNPEWVSGCASPNPRGRPKKERSVTALLEQRADRERLADALLELAYAGDLPAIRLVLERLDGLPPSHAEQAQAWDADERRVQALERGLIAQCDAATPAGRIDAMAMLHAIVDGRLVDAQTLLVAAGCDPSLVADAAARLYARLDDSARRDLRRREREEAAAAAEELEMPRRDAVELSH